MRAIRFGTRCAQGALEPPNKRHVPASAPQRNGGIRRTEQMTRSAMPFDARAVRLF
jgi:hypothetical protein